MKNLLTLALLSILLYSCGDQPTQEQAAEKMSDFADDPAFRELHDEPRSVTLKHLGTMMELPAEGGEPANAYVINPGKEQVLFVIQEWWGMNDYIKAEAERLSDELENTTIVALDMYDGKVATTREQAQKYMQGATDERLNQIVQAGLTYAGPDAKIGTIGWCFGGAWSLKTAIAAGERAKACVMYYGMPVKTAAELAPLQAPVLGIFAEQDKYINREVIGKFEALAAATQKELIVKWYEADHAFANPTQERYNADAAAEANEYAVDFLADHLNR